MKSDTIYAQSDSISVKADTKTIILIKDKEHESEFLGLTAELWITVIAIPLTAFFLGLLVNKIRDIYRRKNRLVSDQEFISIWIKIVVKQLKKQIISYEQTTEDFKKWAEKDPKPIKTYSLHIDKLRTISASELTSIFVINKAAKQQLLSEYLFDFSNSLDFIERKNQEINDGGQKIETRRNELIGQWNVSIIKMNSMIDRFYRQYPNNPFVKDCHNAYEKRKKESDAFRVTQKYALIYYDICKKYDVDSLTSELLEVVQNVRRIYLELDGSYQVFSIALKDAAKELKDRMIELEAAFESLEKIRFKVITH